MTKEQEAQQAQTIAHDPVAYAYEQLRRRLRHDAECKDAPCAVDDLIEMAISQAQKIAEQAKEIEMLRNVTNAIQFGTYTALEVRLHMEKLAGFDAKR